MWDWSDRIRKVRRVAGLSQREMARLAGVRPSTWSAWEAGRNAPRDGEARRVAGALAGALAVSPQWLLGLPDQQLYALLPRMDSNHQPPDWRSDRGVRGEWRASSGFPDPPICDSDHNNCDSYRGSHCLTVPITSGSEVAIGDAACR